MEYSNISELFSNRLILGLAATFLFTSLAILTSNKRRRESVLHQLHLRKRRTSGAKTPPRSLSPGRAPSTFEKKPLGSLANDYATVFPPSRRDVLLQLDLANSVAPEPEESATRDNPLSTNSDDDFEGGPPKCTATGFSTAEINSMGKFPSYEILSGVPLPQPYLGFNAENALPRPYRPFRWAYHQTMSLTKMEPDWWLEVENTYLTRLTERKALFEEHGKQVLNYLPGSELACKELMEMSLQFYCARYPSLFSLSADNSLFHNGLTQKTTDLVVTHPLHVLLDNVPEDFAIVLRNETDGLYYFRAGVICSSLGWNVATKIGLCLREIHAYIPDYKAKMAFSMDRFFSKMPTNAPIQRGSWGLEIGQPLFMPPGHPHEKTRETQKEGLTVDECFLRVDWQTLRRLPRSGAIVFNYKALFTPVTEFRNEPYIPALLLKVLKEGKKNLMDYKNTWHVEHACLAHLEAYAAEQREKGWVKGASEDEEWKEETLADAPFFPGWEEKWHQQQGF